MSRLRAWAAGHGQILFCESPVGGALILLGLVPITPRGALLSALACGIATAIAEARGFPQAEWRRGLYGYVAALVGLFWGVLFAPTLAAHVTLVVAATLAAPVTRFAHRVLTPRQVPALAIPALVLVTAAAPFLPFAGTAPAPTLTLEAIGWASTLAGLAFGSWMLAAAAVLGAGAGAATSLAITGELEGGIIGNAVPAAIALGAVLLPWSTGAVIVAVIAASGAGALWWWMAPSMAALGLPALAWPFVIVTVVTVRLLRVPIARRLLPGHPAPLLLASVGDPAVGRAGHRARAELLRMLEAAERVCVLTGAGVSTAAGLPDFRGPAGFWAHAGRITLQDFVASPEQRDQYWREEERFFRRLMSARPTRLHRALAGLGEADRLTAVITQNVDGLHQEAGLDPALVIEIHGNMREAQCIDCGRRVPREALSVAIAMGVGTLYCDACQGLVKGGSVMFGETVSPARLDGALRALLGADLLLVLGTSLAVAPATHMLKWAREAGVPVVIVNATATAYDADVNLAVTADVDAVVADAVATMLRRSRRPATAPVG